MRYNMIIEHFLLSVNETNSYIVACSETRSAVIIDPGEWSPQMAEFVNQQELEVESILITHAHYDHTGGVQALREQYAGVQVYSHASDDLKDGNVSDGDVLELGKLKIRVFETPGHTDDSITFVVGCDVFCGDLLFAGSVGGTPDDEHFYEEIKSIREKIIPLGDDMLVHPGHGPATTIAIERLYNPFLMT
ncbi:MBL fold metallo-hydrolase [candidate division LCP-89 bacterium B3_LCP]|uniref:MBL fold metallo-hydrolase n=1 Tax=candidate division LCP-89 bacterium B3_LCP TaxID=2012998 RepID=A0A532V3A4_UNCL8|nr:MAG: MBL fold metallo-hydrolase [candidate division LCP-89 bacterium B3_LCP]